MNINEEQWLTGFTEGDGSISLHSTKYTQITYGQKERPVLEYVRTLIGKSKIYDYNTEHPEVVEKILSERSPK